MKRRFGVLKSNIGFHLCINIALTLVWHLFGKSQDAISDINTLVLDLVDVDMLSLL